MRELEDLDRRWPETVSWLRWCLLYPVEWDHSFRRQDTQPRDQACYALTGSHSLSALFGTADYISQSGAVRAGFRMALHEGEVRVYCCSGSKDCHEWPPCRHVTLPIGHEEIAHELWLSE